MMHQSTTPSLSSPSTSSTPLRPQSCNEASTSEPVDPPAPVASLPPSHPSPPPATSSPTSSDNSSPVEQQKCRAYACRAHFIPDGHTFCAKHSTCGITGLFTPEECEVCCVWVNDLLDQRATSHIDHYSQSFRSLRHRWKNFLKCTNRYQKGTVWWSNPQLALDLELRTRPWPAHSSDVDPSTPPSQSVCLSGSCRFRRPSYYLPSPFAFLSSHSRLIPSSQPSSDRGYRASISCPFSTF